MNQRGIMKNLSGFWIGEMNGTNQGRMVIELKHEGDRLYGQGHFNEPTLGTYRYNVQGVTQKEKIKLVLTPIQDINAHLMLGNINAEAIYTKDGKIDGTWKSTIGTAGSFQVSRKENSENEGNTQGERLGNSIFIVHGHDDATKEKVARFIEKLNLDAIILHEKVNKGHTIIEKFEEYSKQANFAIVLFTPDDIGYPLEDETHSKPRARQNVVLEMGYFIGLLGREKVCVLYKGDVELPSDILGIVYTKIDEPEAWKLSLAKELKTVGYDVDLNKLIT